AIHPHADHELVEAQPVGRILPSDGGAVGIRVGQMLLADQREGVITHGDGGQRAAVDRAGIGHGRAVGLATLGAAAGIDFADGIAAPGVVAVTPATLVVVVAVGRHDVGGAAATQQRRGLAGFRLGAPGAAVVGAAEVFADPVHGIAQGGAAGEFGAVIQP